MTRIRVVIVDDEPIARRGIRQLLAPHADVDVAGEARNGLEAVDMLRTLTPDLVFLDVQMPEMDGFDVLRQLDAARLPAVIFVTAHDTFAVRAFELHAIDYLVKPVHEARFQAALSRARERLHSREAIELSRRLSHLLAQRGASPDDLAATAAAAAPVVPASVAQGGVAQGAVAPTAAAPAASDPPRRLVIATGSGADLVLDIAEIDWIEADDYYAAIHACGRRHLLRESLASLDARLDRTQFVRVHRSAIVNLARVRELRSQASGAAALVLRDGTELPLSRRRREQVAAAIRRFAG